MANFVKLAEDYTRQIEKVWNEVGLDISQQNERRLILYKKIDEGFKDFLLTVNYKKVIHHCFIISHSV